MRFPPDPRRDVPTAKAKLANKRWPGAKKRETPTNDFTGRQPAVETEPWASSWRVGPADRKDLPVEVQHFGVLRERWTPVEPLVVMIGEVVPGGTVSG